MCVLINTSLNKGATTRSYSNGFPRDIMFILRMEDAKALERNPGRMVTDRDRWITQKSRPPPPTLQLKKRVTRAGHEDGLAAQKRPHRRRERLRQRGHTLPYGALPRLTASNCCRVRDCRQQPAVAIHSSAHTRDGHRNDRQIYYHVQYQGILRIIPPEFPQKCRDELFQEGWDS